jgi:hypothetical protein
VLSTAELSLSFGPPQCNRRLGSVHPSTPSSWVRSTLARPPVGFGPPQRPAVGFGLRQRDLRGLRRFVSGLRLSRALALAMSDAFRKRRGIKEFEHAIGSNVGSFRVSIVTSLWSARRFVSCWRVRGHRRVARDRSRTAPCRRNRHNRRNPTQGHGTDASAGVVFRRILALLLARFTALIARAVMSSPILHHRCGPTGHRFAALPAQQTPSLV